MKPEQFPPTPVGQSTSQAKSTPSYTSSDGNSSTDKSAGEKDDEVDAASLNSPVRSDNHPQILVTTKQDSALLVPDLPLPNEGQKKKKKNKKARLNNRRRQEIYKRSKALSPNDITTCLQSLDGDQKNIDTTAGPSDGLPAAVVDLQLRGGTLHDDGTADLSSESSGDDPSPSAFGAAASNNDEAVNEPADDQPVEETKDVQQSTVRERKITLNDKPALGSSARPSRLHPASRRRTIFGSLGMWFGNP